MKQKEDGKAKLVGRRSLIFFMIIIIAREYSLYKLMYRLVTAIRQKIREIVVDH